jgi:PAS domain S-box-containing protein
LEKHRKHLEDLVKERTTDLAKLNSEQQTILDSVRATIWYKDTENNIIKVNKAAAESVGIKVEDIEGHSCSELFPKEAEQYFQDDLEVINSEKPKLGIIEQLQTTSGEKLWVQTDKIPFKDENGKTTGLIAFAIDITKRKEAEDRLKERYTEVSNLNKAMINLLEDYEEAQKNLLKSQHQIEMTNKELESFSYSVSHDLRAPLRGLDGFSQIILEDYQDKLDEEGKDYLQRIRAASKRMGLLIDALLRLSRITRADLKPEQINLSSLVSKITTELGSSGPKRQVSFIIQPNVTATGDQQLIKIVLENILGNAWKFTGRKKSTKIEFGTKQFANDKETVYFIKDDGVGFNMEYADKLFDAFQRLHSSDEFEGTGIGLATVNRIIQRHQGKIWAESKVNKGAVFYFTLN